MKIELTKEDLDRLIINMDQLAVEYGDRDDAYLLEKLIKFRNMHLMDEADENRSD